ncbi:basic salivary proline-rich protein 2-like [Thalassophryne amazonica]|uniref:basic salivary proline-rich protein 2-like n=1 Tax=Thalassophryne amazonica TaxID=390379 RepID=UPI001470E5C9|nr:basic salivary proline-rich protein 2-like [Thalassophryne amazonica]
MEMGPGRRAPGGTRRKREAEEHRGQEGQPPEPPEQHNGPTREWPDGAGTPPQRRHRKQPHTQGKHAGCRQGPSRGGAQSTTLATAPRERSKQRRGQGAKAPSQLNPERRQGPPAYEGGARPPEKRGDPPPGPGSTRGPPDT